MTGFGPCADLVANTGIWGERNMDDFGKKYVDIYYFLGRPMTHPPPRRHCLRKKNTWTNKNAPLKAIGLYPPHPYILKGIGSYPPHTYILQAICWHSPHR